MKRLTQLLVLAAFLINHSVYTAPIDNDTEDRDIVDVYKYVDIEDMEEKSDSSISDEVINDDDDDETSDPDVITTREKRYFDNFLENQSMDQRRERIHLLKQKNLRDQKRRKEQRKKKLRRNGRKKLRVNRNTSSEKCVTNSPAHLVKLLLMIHSQKVRDRVAGQWLRDCSGDKAELGARRSVRTSSVRYFG